MCTFLWVAEVVIPLGLWLVGMNGCQDNCPTPFISPHLYPIYAKDTAKDSTIHFEIIFTEFSFPIPPSCVRGLQ